MHINYSTVKQQKEAKAKKNIKKAVWLYFWLLIFEGALRKWFLAPLAAPLLIVRDPVAIWILITAINNNYLKRNIFVFAAIVTTAISFMATMMVGHQNLFVAVFGARIFLLHFPLIFVIATVFNHDDVVKMGKAIVWLTPPMTVLIALQFYSPQTAWVNRGVGGDESGAGFSGALGYFRPPATFSFISGTTLFFSLAGAFILYFWFNAALIKKWLLILATVAWLASIPICISRTLFFQAVATTLFLFPAIIRNPKYISRAFIVMGSIAGIFVILALSPILQTATEAFSARYNSANESGGGVQVVLLDRILGGIISAFQYSYNQPFLGYGLGMGTSAGSQLLTGKAQFLISEQEWARMIGESGLLLGIVFILVRVGIIFSALRSSLQQLAKGGDILPWLLLSVGFLQISQGEWGGPTILGFSVIIGGLMFACFKKISG